MSLVNAINSAVAAAARVGLTAFPDTCDLIGVTSISQGSGHTSEDATLASGITCLVEQIGGGTQVEPDSVNRTTSHRIYMKITDEALLVDHHYRIKVLARDSNTELIFEQPVREIGSYNAFVTVTAVLTSGYRRPGSL